MKLYVASSWRNTYQPEIVALLRAIGHVVYDFRHPSKDDHGFGWSEIDEEWEKWTPEEFVKALSHPTAERGFAFDMNALDNCEAVVMVLPCGRSAHLELGYAIGQNKPCWILINGRTEPELMYKMVGITNGAVTTSVVELLQAITMFQTRRDRGLV